MSSYLPAGAEYDSSAPYNQKEQEPLYIDVAVCISMSKTFKVPVTDYQVEPDYDDEGTAFTSYNTDECDLSQAVEDNVTLPDEAWKYIKDNSKVSADMKGWTVDDIEYIKE